jgi:holin-like protein
MSRSRAGAWRIAMRRPRHTDVTAPPPTFPSLGSQPGIESIPNFSDASTTTVEVGTRATRGAPAHQFYQRTLAGSAYDAPMLRALALLFTCQLAGEIAARGLSLPVPGPVLGLLLLVARARRLRRWARPFDDAVSAGHVSLGRTAAGLLGSLALLFVPAGVGVTQHLPLLVGDHGACADGLALVGSTLVTLARHGLASSWLVSRLVGRGDGRPASERPFDAVGLSRRPRRCCGSR